MSRRPSSACLRYSGWAAATDKAGAAAAARRQPGNASGASELGGTYWGNVVPPIGTASRWRFHPPSPLAFRLGLAAFPVRPSETTSTHSRSVLGASGKLLQASDSRKALSGGSTQSARNSSCRRFWCYAVSTDGNSRPVRSSFSFLPSSPTSWRFGSVISNPKPRSRTPCHSSLSAPSA